MRLQIRPGDLSVDEPAVIELLARCLNPNYDKPRFDWLYRTNPAGRGRLWVAVEEGRGEIIGTAAAFPRVVCVNGGEAPGWVLGDFCVAESYRALGPALMLQRACLDGLATDPASLWYDFPAAAMMPIYRRLGHVPAGRMSRRVKLLRLDTRLDRLRPVILGRGLAFVANRLLAVGTWPRRAPRDLTTAIHKGAVGEEFSELSARVASRYAFCLARSAAYLTWRYLENPTRHCELVATRRGRELQAYAVVSQDGDQASLLDIFGVAEPRIIAALLRGVLSLLRDRGCHAVGCALLDSHPWQPMLSRLGFVARESAPVMLSASAPPELRAATPVGGGWLLIDGDRDG